MFQAHIRWNEIENNAIKMYLYEKFKTDVLRTSEGRNPTDFFLGCFEDVHWTSLQNFTNKQQLTFKYFTQLIW